MLKSLNRKGSLWSVCIKSPGLLEEYRKISKLGWTCPYTRRHLYP